MKKYSILLILSLLIFSSQQSLGKQPMSYKSGEKLVFEIYYTLGFLNFNVAQAVMQVDPVEFNGVKAYRLLLYANTHKGYGANTLNDTLTAYINRTTLSPLYMVQASHENKYHAWNKYRYSYSDKANLCQIERIRAKGSSFTNVTDERSYFDVLTFVYHLRNSFQPEQLSINQKVGALLVLDDGLYSLYWRFAGPARIQLKNKKIYDCYKIKPAFVDSQLFEEGEMMTIYLSDDQNKMPVMIEAKLKIGSIKAYLVESKNMLYPINSLVSSPK